METHIKKNIYIVTHRKESLLQQLLKSKHVNSFLYNFQIENDTKSEIKSEKKWETEFEVVNWKKVYTLPIKSTIDSRLRNFQYKYLLRIIPTNKSLYKFKLVDSNLCDFCIMNIDSLKHMFWECNHVQHFWNQLQTFLNRINDMNISLNFLS